MNRSIFILIPAPEPTGPVKGAVALANALVETRSVTLVTLRAGSGMGASIDPNVMQISFADLPRGIICRAKAYSALLKKAGGRLNVASISMCFSADIVNLYCRGSAVICSSVRGNLPINYKMEYGLRGSLLAIGHLMMLRFFDHTVAMTSAMATQVKFYSRRAPTVIGNFVDERSLNKYRFQRKHNNSIKFIFLGSLTERKQPLLLLETLTLLLNQGLDVALDILGDGPLKPKLLATIRKNKLCNHVLMHGQVDNPYEILARADVLVIPSLSEGVSRAAMEALHLGVPCVLRNVDGNTELVQNGLNGILFHDNDELASGMIAATELSRSNLQTRKSLLPSKFRQRKAANGYLHLIECEK